MSGPRPVVLSGPSGAGKSTLMKRLMKEHEGIFGFSTQQETHDQERKTAKTTTILPESGHSRRDRQEPDVHPRCGHPGSEEDQRDRVEPHLHLHPAPSMDILEKRLRDRQTETEESLQKRLEAARIDMELSNEPGVFDVVIINDDLERAYEELRDILSDVILQFVGGETDFGVTGAMSSQPRVEVHHAAAVKVIHRAQDLEEQLDHLEARQEGIDNGDFIENAEFSGNMYGTSQAVEQLLAGAELLHQHQGFGGEEGGVQLQQVGWCSLLSSWYSLSTSRRCSAWYGVTLATNTWLVSTSLQRERTLKRPLREERETKTLRPFFLLIRLWGARRSSGILVQRPAPPVRGGVSVGEANPAIKGAGLLYGGLHGPPSLPTCWKQSQESASSYSEEDPLLGEELLCSCGSRGTVTAVSLSGASSSSGISLSVRTDPMEQHVEKALGLGAPVGHIGASQFSVPSPTRSRVARSVSPTNGQRHTRLSGHKEGYISVMSTRVRRVQKKSSRQATRGCARRDSRSLSWKPLVRVLLLTGRNLAANTSPVRLWTTRFTTPKVQRRLLHHLTHRGRGGGSLFRTFSSG
ncbi:hypothetical protein F7725_027324 [Dissostichus mawsoni]|uniref:Guanylate kinase-like domain-containing protein n=1 Tax=Dissostichus mawsoni TaxID=36200 RepID=A0A7J5XCK7_DISMA|nr:hypothetical protein F7725_027324 [Dissostichus mawsoni]